MKLAMGVRCLRSVRTGMSFGKTFRFFSFFGGNWASSGSRDECDGEGDKENGESTHLDAGCGVRGAACQGLR